MKKKEKQGLLSLKANRFEKIKESVGPGQYEPYSVSVNKAPKNGAFIGLAEKISFLDQKQF